MLINNVSIITIKNVMPDEVMILLLKTKVQQLANGFSLWEENYMQNKLVVKEIDSQKY